MSTTRTTALTILDELIASIEARISLHGAELDVLLTQELVDTDALIAAARKQGALMHQRVLTRAQRDLEAWREGNEAHATVFADEPPEAVDAEALV